MKNKKSNFLNSLSPLYKNILIITFFAFIILSIIFFINGGEFINSYLPILICILLEILFFGIYFPWYEKRNEQNNKIKLKELLKNRIKYLLDIISLCVFEDPEFNISPGHYLNETPDFLQRIINRLNGRLEANNFISPYTLLRVINFELKVFHSLFITANLINTKHLEIWQKMTIQLESICESYSNRTVHESELEYIYRGIKYFLEDVEIFYSLEIDLT